MAGSNLTSPITLQSTTGLDAAPPYGSVSGPFVVGSSPTGALDGHAGELAEEVGDGTYRFTGKPAMKDKTYLVGGVLYTYSGTAFTALGTTDPETSALAGLTSAADKLPYFTGDGTMAVTTFTAAGRALVDDAAASNQRTTLGLVIGTDVQAQDAELAALAGLTLAADKGIHATAAETLATHDQTASARTVLAINAVAGDVLVCEATGTWKRIAGPAGGDGNYQLRCAKTGSAFVFSWITEVIGI